jgi:hypothetical protein
LPDRPWYRTSLRDSVKGIVPEPTAIGIAKRWRPADEICYPLARTSHPTYALGDDETRKNSTNCTNTLNKARIIRALRR